MFVLRFFLGLSLLGYPLLTSGQDISPVDGLSSGAVVLLSARPGGERSAPVFSDGAHQKERDRMVSQAIRAEGVGDPAVLGAMRRVPRHEFVPEHLRASAYENIPLPIGHDQTISQPFIVGYMTELLRLKEGDRVLEVGTGSGYQAAVLAEIAEDVVSIEIVEALARKSAARLEELGYQNITVLWGDGYLGWKTEAPYDAIIVTAVAPEIPPPLLEQLKPGGRLVIPMGQEASQHELMLVEKDEEGEVSMRTLLPVRFVPLTRERR